MAATTTEPNMRSDTTAVTPSPTAIRWMWIWITLGVLVVLVVIGFLFSIADALESIDGGLEEANTAVGGAEGDVNPLPDNIENINLALGSIDSSLKPIPDQADMILAELESISSSLDNVDVSLIDTSGSLGDTSGTLGDASGRLGGIAGALVETDNALGDVSGSLDSVSASLDDTSPTLSDAGSGLVSIEGLATQIDRRLELAQNFNSLGTNGIFKRVRFLNGGMGTGPGPGAIGDGMLNRDGLGFAEGDAREIVTGLGEINRHLTSICRDLDVFAGASGGRC